MPVISDDYRPDGTPKGPGFLGALMRPDGRLVMEAPMWVKIDGKDVLIPLLVPTLSHKEVADVLGSDKPKESIVRKAIAHAVERMGDGLSPFKEERDVEPPDTSERKTEYEEGAEEKRRNVIIQMQRKRSEANG